MVFLFFRTDRVSTFSFNSETYARLHFSFLPHEYNISFSSICFLQIFNARDKYRFYKRDNWCGGVSIYLLTITTSIVSERYMVCFSQDRSTFHL